MDKFPVTEKDLARIHRRRRMHHHERIACPTKSTLLFRRRLKKRSNRLDRRKAKCKIKVGIPIKFPLTKTAAQKGLPQWFKVERGQSPRAA